MRAVRWHCPPLLHDRSIRLNFGSPLVKEGRCPIADVSVIRCFFLHKYAPPPTTTAIKPTSLPESVNQFGFPPTVTISGTGFNFLTFQQVTFGPAGTPYTTADSMVTYFEPNELQLYYFGLNKSAPITKMPMTVHTVGGESNPQSVAITAEVVGHLETLGTHDGRDDSQRLGFGICCG